MNKKNVPAVTECSIWLLYFFQKLAFECNALRIEVDCTKSRSYVEIDAIKIIGTTDRYQQVVLKPTPVTNSSNVEQTWAELSMYILKTIRM
jgi:hypothetical protein